MNVPWTKVRLGQICSFKYGQMPKKEDLADTGYPVFSGYGIVGFSTKFHYETPEIIIVARGVGGAGDVKMSPPFCFLTNLSIAALIQDSRVHKPFLYYRLAGPGLWELRTGSAQAQITISHLLGYEIELPPLDVQRRIASMLSVYDDLIEVNRRRIALLDDIARRLFDEWFVRFRFPNFERRKFIESAVGPIPDNWNIKQIDGAFEILGGGTPSKTKPLFWEKGSINWYTPSDLTAAKAMFMDESSKRISEEGLRNSSAKMFPAFSVMLTSRATIGVVSINTTEASTNQGFIICIPNEQVPLCFLYYWVRANVPQFIAKAGGSTFKEITKGVFRRLPIALPPADLLESYEEHIRPLLDMVLCIERSQRRLVQSRDLLLPRLISGELSVPTAERELEAVA